MAEALEVCDALGIGLTAKDPAEAVEEAIRVAYHHKPSDAAGRAGPTAAPRSTC